MNDVAREAYERHMRKALGLRLGLAHTALATGALRPAELELPELMALPRSAWTKREVLDENGTLGPAKAVSDVRYVTHVPADWGHA